MRSFVGGEKMAKKASLTSSTLVMTALFGGAVAYAQTPPTSAVGVLTNIEATADGLLLKLDQGASLPASCNGSPGGWMLVREANKTLVGQVLGLWASGRMAINVSVEAPAVPGAYCVVVAAPQSRPDLASAPTLAVSYEPQSVAAGQNYSIKVQSRHVQTLRAQCEGAYSGPAGPWTIGAETVTLGPFVANSSYAGSTRCDFVGENTGSGLQATASATQSILGADQMKPPTLTVSYEPQVVTAGQSYSIKFVTTNAQEVRAQCRGAYNGPAGPWPITAGVQTVGPVVALTANSGETECTFVAENKNAGLTATAKAAQYIRTPAGTIISVSLSPNTLTAGQNYYFSYHSNTAVRLEFSCQGVGPEPASGTLPLTGGVWSTQVQKRAGAKGVQTCTYRGIDAGGVASTVQTVLTAQ